MGTDFRKDFIGDARIKMVTDTLGSRPTHSILFDCPPLDIPFGGGIKSGKIIEVFGRESSGKTLLTLGAAKAFCDYWRARGHDKYCVLWIECESAFDPLRAKWIGCPVDTNFLICEAETVEEAEEIITATLTKAKNTETKFLLVWDTIAAASTQKEKEVGIHGGGMIEKPRLIRKMFRKITPMLGETDSTLILVNQVYDIIGSYVPTVETPGGGGIKFHASVRVNLTAKEKLTELRPDGTEVTKGLVVEAFFKKNKITAPHQKAMIIMYGESGLDSLETCMMFLIRNKLVTVNGPWKILDHPVSYAVDGKPAEMTQLKYQNLTKIRETIETQYPCVKDWIHFLVYRQFLDVSPLIKINIIDKVWEYEMKFFGEKRSILTDKEIEAAKLIRRELDDPMADSEDDDGETEKKPEKKKRSSK